MSHFFGRGANEVGEGFCHLRDVQLNVVGVVRGLNWGVK